MSKEKKDKILSAGISAFMSTFGAMIPYGFEAKSLFAGIAGALIGSAAGAAFKESRRFSERPKKFYLPYMAGTVVGLGVAALIWSVI